LTFLEIDLLGVYVAPISLRSLPRVSLRIVLVIARADEVIE